MYVLYYKKVIKIINQNDVYIIELLGFLAKDLIVYKYLTWIAVLVSKIFDLFANILATSTSPYALIILLSAFLLATAAETNYLYNYLDIPKSIIYLNFTF